jgi:hypothetical protein
MRLVSVSGAVSGNAWVGFAIKDRKIAWFGTQLPLLLDEQHMALGISHPAAIRRVLP